MSGLLVRRVWPLALMLCAERGPKSLARTRSAMTQTGSPGPRNDRICITSSCPRQLVVPIDLPPTYAASNSVGSRYLSPRAMIAHAIRAILLAKATAATLVGRRAINRPNHGCFFVPCFCA